MRVALWLMTSPSRRTLLPVILTVIIIFASFVTSGPFRRLLRRLDDELLVEVDVFVVQEDSYKETSHTEEGGNGQPCFRYSFDTCGQLNASLSQKPAVSKATHKLKHLTDLPDDLESFMAQPIINPHHYGFVHNLESFWKDGSTDIVMVIASRPEHFYRRREIREDKLDMLNFSRMYRIKTLFFTGLPNPSFDNSDLGQTLINLEAESYKDIIQGDFVDVFSNRTLKTVSMLKWVLTYCPQVRYVILTTDDVILNIKVITALRKVGRTHDNFILGQITRNLPLSSDPGNEYYNTDRAFLKNDFPPFAVRGLQGFPLSTAQLLYEASLRIEPLEADDVYISGVCARKTRVELLEDRHFRFDSMNIDNTEEVI